MGSYLNHVAAKALGQSVALQPRVPSLFEPPPTLRLARVAPFPSLQADPETRLDAGESVTHQSESWSRDRASRRETPLASVDDKQSVGDRQTPDSNQATVSRITGNKPRRPVSIEPAVLPVDETRLGPSPEGLARAKSRIALATTPGTEQVRPEAIEPPKLTNTRVATAQLRRAAPATDTQSDTTSYRKFEVRDSERAVSVRPEVRSVAAPERTEAVDHLLRPAPKTLTSSRAEASEVEEKDRGLNVSVVIGRVNVQAVLPQPTPVRLAHLAPPPMLSLEQYLKQRGGRS
jgi:hypothetical protein